MNMKMTNINDNTMNIFPFEKIGFNRRKFYNGQLFYLKCSYIQHIGNLLNNIFANSLCKLMFL